MFNQRCQDKSTNKDMASSNEIKIYDFSRFCLANLTKGISYKTSFSGMTIPILYNETQNFAIKFPDAYLIRGLTIGEYGGHHIRAYWPENKDLDDFIGRFKKHLNVKEPDGTNLNEHGERVIYIQCPKTKDGLWDFKLFSPEKKELNPAQLGELISGTKVRFSLQPTPIWGNSFKWKLKFMFLVP